MSLDCEACDALLIDLVERELDETHAAEVRAHAESCESCGRSLLRLEGGRRAARELVRAEPPRLDAVMAAARAKAADARAARALASAPPAEPGSGAGGRTEIASQSWLDATLHWLGAWAIRPQVAMAALLVLMIGIGVYNLPHFRSDLHDGADGALVEPDVHAELGPTPLAPAEPLELDVDPHTQRVALGAGDQGGAEAPDERPTTTTASGEVRTARAAPPPASAGRAHTETTDVVAEIAPSATVGRVEDGPLPELAEAHEQTAAVLASAPMGLSAGRATSAPMPPPTPPSDEVAPTTPSAAALLPAAILRQARALASAGHCDEAVPRYRSLLADHPDSADAPRAMLELAECDRRLGRIDEADHWLARAEAFPSVSADARRARMRIDTERHAYDRAADQAAASTSAAPTSE